MPQANSLTGLNFRTKKYSCGRYTSAAVGSFGANVAGLRKRRGLKGVELAKAINVKPPVLSAWEHDRGGLPETPTLLKLAKALGVSIDALLAGVDPAYDLICHPTDQASRSSTGVISAFPNPKPGN